LRDGREKLEPARHEENSLNQLTGSNKRYAPIYLVAVAGVILAIAAFYTVRYIEIQNIKARFSLETQNRINAVEREIEVNLEAVRSLHSFYLSSEEVTREEFRQFTSHLLSRHPSVQAFEWIPRITLSQRNLYEEKAGGEYPGFQITEREEQGTIVRAREREEYFPVYFVEPYNGNETALGFDLTSNPTRLQALNNARDTGMIAATSRITLVQEKEKQYGFLVVIPVYQKNISLDTVEDRRNNLTGFVLGVFRVRDIVERTRSYLMASGIDSYLYDVSVPGENINLYTHNSATNGDQSVLTGAGVKYTGNYYIEKTLKVADKTWKITGTPGAAFIAHTKDWHAWGASAGILSIAFLIALYLKKMLDQTSYAEGLVRKLGDEIVVRKEVEIEIINREKEFRSLFENMNEAFGYHRIIVDEKNRPVDYEFILVNNAFEKATGLKKEDVLGKKVTEVIPGIRDSKPDLIGIYGEVALTGKETAFELYFEPFDKWYHVNAYSQRKAHFVTVFDDISDRKKSEQEREHFLTELKSKNRELEQILYVTSHDLRSPLVNVEGFSRELDFSLKKLMTALDKVEMPSDTEETVARIMKNEVPESMTYITKSISKMDTLLKGLLKLSRLGRLELSIEQIDMDRMISDVVSNFEFRLKESGIKVNVSAMPLCRGDIGQINQVFSNLLDNAIKHIDPGKPGIINISGRQENNQSIYCIEDNGVGIDPGHQEKIFELFHRLEPEKSQGEGLGLTIAYMIVERHNGEIWVESEPGKGSRFYVTLPC
jgi:PAS domain S-box-containing protein